MTLFEMLTDITRTQANELIDLQNKVERARQMSAELQKEREAEDAA